MTSPTSRALATLAASVLLATLALVAPAGAGAAATGADRPARAHALVIGHRGASGYRPEHTLASYRLAIRQCADFIEPDLVSTKDGVLVARHENEIGGTTDVEDHPEFADRETTKVIDGTSITGWFTEDFTLAELRTLRAEERIPDIRPRNTRFDGRFPIPTLKQVIRLAKSRETCDGKRVGIYPETKHPTYFDSIGLSLEEPLVAALDANGFQDRSDPVFVQSFEVGNLEQLDTMTDVRLVQLADCTGHPADDPRPYSQILSRSGLQEVATYADGIGPCKDLVIRRNADGTLGRPTNLVRRAHDAGLVVHPFTFRRENTFLPVDFRVGTNPRAPGNLAGEIRAFLRTGIDGLFSDNPDIAAATVRR